MAVLNWEDALRSLASTQTTVEDRSKVNAATPSWIASYSVDIALNGAAEPTHYDVWWQQVYSVGPDQATVTVGAMLDWSNINAGAPFNLFYNQPIEILDPLNGWQNDTTSPPSFTAAADMLGGIDRWLDTWVTTVTETWMPHIANAGSDMRGSAASAFRDTLGSFAFQLAKLRSLLAAPALAAGLTSAESQLEATVRALQGIAAQWRGGALSTTAGCVNQALVTALQNATATFNGAYYTPIQYAGELSTPSTQWISPTKVTIGGTGYGDPSTQGFWDGVDAAAKSTWTQNVVSVLDGPGVQAMGSLASAYVAVKLPSIPADPLREPASVTGGGTTTTNSDLNSLLNTLMKGGPNPGGNGGNTGGANVPPPVLDSTTSGGKGGPTGGSLGGIGGPTGGSIGGPIGGSTGGSTGGPIGGTTGSNLPGGEVLGPNGRPITDPSTGGPLLVPPGTTIGPGGELIGPDGLPIAGANGKPITVPRGSTIGTPTGGGNVVVPRGSTINADGTVTGPDGRSVLDPNGNPLVLPKGSTIGSDGTVHGPNGKPIPLDTQLLTDQEHALAGPPPPVAAALTSNTPPSIRDLRTSVPTVGGAQLLGTASGISPAALERTTQALAPGSAPSESPLASLVATPPTAAGIPGTAATPPAAGGETPYLPYGATNGLGAGQGAGKQDRQRTTWLSEEEAVWGTDTGAVSGTIGR